MEVTSAAQRRLSILLKRLVTLTFVVLGLLLVVILGHAAAPEDALLGVAQVLVVVLVLLAAASVAAGVTFAWRSYPQHRRAVAFLVAITLVTFLAHLYIIGQPAVSASGSVSGVAGTSFSDKQVSVATSVSGSVLNVTVTASGGNAVANVGVSLGGGGPLSGPGFVGAPTYSAPLQPSTSVSGSFNLPGQSSNSSITVGYQYLTCYSTGSRSYGCIMDEVFYVPEAMGMLAGQHCSTTTSNCHMEHPYLVPALIAGGMALFGEFNTAGWRAMPAILGTLSIPLVFVISWKASGNKRLAYVASILLALDVMFFSQSSGALLDIPETFFGIAAFFAYFVGIRVWKFDKYLVAGAFMGVAGLAKETAIFMALGLLTYIIIFDETSRKARLWNVLKVSAMLALVFLAGLQAYDSTLASPAVPTFYNHISYMLSYGSSLIAHTLLCQGAPTSASGYWCKFPSSSGNYAPILPTDWLVYYSPVAYYATSVSVCPNVVNGVCQGGQYSYVALAYYGVTNLLETWTVYVWVPLAAYVLYRYFKTRQPSLESFGFESPVGSTPAFSGEVKFVALALVWFFWTYVPYIGLFLTGRVTYPFYFVPAIPAVAMGCSFWLTRKWFPRPLVAVYLIMVFVFFFVYFPSKAFLPDWLRVIIGH